ncbi:unnamed protein product [Strongylus vulgaris]|uniref:Uncharacterized protein n=1 Tax=Strongylus vulgaris TaxID=40348 RepID=A0A3P7KF03_STRVU|nr:unnamed protein product [Strongylus vulgaris]
MLKEPNEVVKRIGLRVKRKKTQITKNAFCEDQEMKLEGSPSGDVFYVYLKRWTKIENDLREEVSTRRSAAWAAFGPLKRGQDQLTDPKLRARCSKQLFSLHCAAQQRRGLTLWLRSSLRTTQAQERRLLKYDRRTQHFVGLRSSDIRSVSRLRDPTEYVSKAKHRWTGHTMRRQTKDEY